MFYYLRWTRQLCFNRPCLPLWSSVLVVGHQLLEQRTTRVCWQKMNRQTSTQTEGVVPDCCFWFWLFVKRYHTHNLSTSVCTEDTVILFGFACPFIQHTLQLSYNLLSWFFISVCTVRRNCHVLFWLSVPLRRMSTPVTPTIHPQVFAQCTANHQQLFFFVYVFFCASPHDCSCRTHTLSMSVCRAHNKLAATAGTKGVDVLVACIFVQRQQNSGRNRILIMRLMGRSEWRISDGVMVTPSGGWLYLCVR